MPFSFSQGVLLLNVFQTIQNLHPWRVRKPDSFQGFNAIFTSIHPFISAAQASYIENYKTGSLHSPILGRS